MFFGFTLLFLLFVYTTFECVRLQDVIYIAAMFLPYITYWRRKSQLSVCLFTTNVFTLSQLWVYFMSIKQKNKVASIPLIVLGDVTCTTEEYLTTFTDDLHFLALFMSIALFWIIQMFYCSRVDINLISSYNDEQTYNKVLSTLRDRLYSLRALSFLYVIVVSVTSLIRMKTLPGRWQFLGVSLLTFVTPHVFLGIASGRLWSNKRKEVLAGESDKSEAVE